MLCAAGTVKSADGVSISYHVTGKGKPALVFIHCWCGDSTFWDQQVPYYAQKYKVVTLDLAGHGKSGLGRKTYTIPAFGADVAAVVKKLKLKKVILLGHSMGGSVMVEAANLMPKRVKALIAVDAMRNVEEKFTQAQFDQYIATMRADFKQAVIGFVRMVLPPRTDAKLLARIRDTASSTPAEVGLAAMKAMFDYDLPWGMDKLTVPIHCINSAAGPTNTEIGAKHAASFTVKTMEDTGHFPMMEKPKEFNQLLDETLKEILKK